MRTSTASEATGSIPSPLPVSRTPRASLLGVRRRLVRGPSRGLCPLLRDTDLPDRADGPGDHLDRTQCRRSHPIRRLPVHSSQPRLQPTGGVCSTADPALAQTRQSDRDKAHADADAKHREALAQASIERQELAPKQSAQIIELVEQNTRLTQISQELSQGIKQLTDEIHRKVVAA